MRAEPDDSEQGKPAQDINEHDAFTRLSGPAIGRRGKFSIHAD
jgi:hypothetical protein